MSIKVLNLEIWLQPEYLHPRHWQFGISRTCPSDCIIVEIGFFGFTILKNYCLSNEDSQ